MWSNTKLAVFIVVLFTSSFSFDVDFNLKRFLKGFTAHCIDLVTVEHVVSSEAFSIGENLVDVNVNGNFRGSFPLVFNNNGTLCLTPSLLQSLSIRIPNKMVRGMQSGEHDENCQYTDGDVSYLDIKYAPENFSISIATKANNLVMQTASITASEGEAVILANHKFSSYQ